MIEGETGNDDDFEDIDDDFNEEDDAPHVTESLDEEILLQPLSEKYLSGPSTEAIAA